MSPYITAARQYVGNVLNGIVPVCDEVRAACQRSANDHARIGQPDFPFIFDEAKAARACDFISRLRHTQGPLTGERIKLEPWQCWIICEVFGWCWADTKTRRYKRAYVEVPRGNGKTLLAAGIAMYCAFVEGEKGADCVCAATSMMQSRLCLDTARTMVESNALLKQSLGLKVEAHRVLQPKTNSRFRGLPAKAPSLEGMAVHLGVIDEVHLHKSRLVFDSISTACAKRPQSLLFIITTAGMDSSGVCFELHEFAERLLEGTAQDESFFGVIYTCDADDDIYAEDTLRKANPNWNVSVDVRAVMEEATRAKQIPSQRASYRMRYLNQWTASDGNDTFLDFNAVQRCYDAEIDEQEFSGQPAVLALDLARKVDLCSLVRVHTKEIKGKTHYYAMSRNWMPTETIGGSNIAALRGWVELGHLTATEGAAVDFDRVENEIMDEWAKCAVRDLNFDPMFAPQMISHLQERTERPDAFVELTQFAQNMSDGMTLLEEIVADGRLHTNSPVLLWCLGNLQSQRTGVHFVYPRRPKDRMRKIDAAVALVMALKSIARCALDDTQNDPYTNRSYEEIKKRMWGA
jgi:phage terminase large subunit-like protein